jgi:hypothetical protein
MRVPSCNLCIVSYPVLVYKKEKTGRKVMNKAQNSKSQLKRIKCSCKNTVMVYTSNDIPSGACPISSIRGSEEGSEHGTDTVG